MLFKLGAIRVALVLDLFYGFGTHFLQFVKCGLLESFFEYFCESSLLPSRWVGA